MSDQIFSKTIKSSKKREKQAAFESKKKPRDLNYCSYDWDKVLSEYIA